MHGKAAVVVGAVCGHRPVVDGVVDFLLHTLEKVSEERCKLLVVDLPVVACVVLADDLLRLCIGLRNVCECVCMCACVRVCVCVCVCVRVCVCV
jgi:hypothetical protein